MFFVLVDWASIHLSTIRVPTTVNGLNEFMDSLEPSPLANLWLPFVRPRAKQQIHAGAYTVYIHAVET